MPPPEALERIPTVALDHMPSAVQPGASPPAITPEMQPGASTAALVANLFPLASPPAALPSTSNGVYVGEGLPPVPTKLAVKIRKREFVETRSSCLSFGPPQGMRPAGCAGYCLVGPARLPTPLLGAVFHHVCDSADRTTPRGHIRAYGNFICMARVSQEFDGMTWVRYDAAVKRQAAITGNRQWSKIYPTLYSLGFAGRPQLANRCKLCMDSSHTTKECALFTDPDPKLPNRLKAIESAVLATDRRPRSSGGGMPPSGAMPTLECQPVHIPQIPIPARVSDQQGSPPSGSLHETRSLSPPRPMREQAHYNKYADEAVPVFGCGSQSWRWSLSLSPSIR